MPDYKESTVAGKSWNRFREIRIDNRRGGIPVLYLHEERIVALADGRELSEPIGTLELPIADPSYPITLRDPNTGEPTGALLTIGEAYAMVYSLCIQEALIRDGVISRPAASPTPSEE